MGLLCPNLTIQEFALKERFPLTAIHAAILDFLKGRTDSVLFGAHAVNAYIDEPRATQIVDIMSTAPDFVAHSLRDFLSERLGIAVRVRQAENSSGRRVYQIRREEGNRHLADVRGVDLLPQAHSVEGIAVLEIAPLIAAKLIATVRRKGRPKALTDARDLSLLLLRFPELKSQHGEVASLLPSGDSEILAEWSSWVEREILPEDDDGY